MPVLATRSLDEFPIANEPIARHRERWLARGIAADPRAWLDDEDLATWLAAGASHLVDAGGRTLAWTGDRRDHPHTARHSRLIEHSWELLAAHERHLAALADDLVEGELHPAAVVDGHLRLGPGSRVLPGVVIEGNVVIGADCKIGPNCYLRGNTSIGDRCHVGNAVEIKNSILLSDTNVGHLSYVGDSILGAGVNFGAGTITSNLRHDGANHRTLCDGRFVDTGRRKFGCIVGDGVHTGINTSLYPARKLAPGTTTRPGEIVQHDL